MKKFTQQSIFFIALLAIAGFAGITSAQTTANSRPNCAVTDEACIATTNTSFPVNIGIDSQIKSGHLIVDAFTANKNAGFDALVNIKGILRGDATGTNSTLAFGLGTRVVDVAVNGATYVQGGGLYSGKVAAPTGESKALCATKKGEIVFCDGSSGTGNVGGGTTGGGLTVSSYSVVLNGNQTATCTVNLSGPAPAGQTVTASVKIDYNIMAPSQPITQGTKSCGVTIGFGESTSTTTIVLTSGTTFAAMTGQCVESSSSNATINPAIKC